MPQGTPTFRDQKGEEDQLEKTRKEQTGSNKQPRRVCRRRRKDPLCEMFLIGQITRGLKINPFDKKEDKFD